MSDVPAEKQLPDDAEQEDSTRERVEEETDGKSATNSGDGNANFTEEEENMLLADDDDDLDVIDCYTEDFDSDMENEFCRKEASKEKQEVSKAEQRETENDENKVDKVDEKERTAVEKKSKEIPLEAVVDNSKGNGFAKTLPFPDDDDDEDVIQIDDISDMLFEVPISTAVDKKPVISLGVKNETEKERILREPLVKQMIIPEVCVSDDEDGRNSVGSQESLSLQIDHFVEKVSEIMEGIQEKQKADGNQNIPAAKTGSAMNSSCENTEGGIYGSHQEDPDVLRLKLDLYQDMGEMDYELDDKTDEDGEKHSSLRIKQEPLSPVQQLSDYLKMNDIPTIDLTTTDDEAEPVDRAKVEVPKPKKRKMKHKKSKKKTSSLSSELKMESSEDSFPIVIESTISERSIESRIKNDSEGSYDDVVERVKSLRNRTVTIVPDTLPINTATKKSRAHMKSIEKELKEPLKKKKKFDPTMLGYKRRKSVGRSASKCSVLSASTGTSSVLDEDIIVISANDILLADPNSIEGRILNTENECTPADKSAKGAAACKSETESKEALMSSLALKEAIVKDLKHDTAMDDNDVKKQEPGVNSFAIPTTDIALEDMLDSWIEQEPSGNETDGVFHSISPEEKFLMDSLFADCEKQSQQLPSQDHLESLTTIMDDGKPLVEKANEESISLCYTICDGTTQTEVVHMLVDASHASASALEPVKNANKIKPHIKIIQNYQKYPFQNKPSKKQQQANKNAAHDIKQRGRRGRKRTIGSPESDEEYRPSKKRITKRRVPNKPLQAKQQSTPSKMDINLTEKHLPIKGAVKDKKRMEAQDESDAETTSSLCIHMPTLEQDLALTSSDSSMSIAGNRSSNKSKAQCLKLPLKSGTPVRSEEPLKTKGLPEPSESLSTKRKSRVVGRNKEKSCSEQSLLDEKKTTNKPVHKRNRRRLTSSSSDEEGTIPAITNAVTETEPALLSCASSLPSEPDQVAAENNTAVVGKELHTMDTLQVVISPLTEEKIRKINTPLKKPKTIAKACQTEIYGMTWSIDLHQIDFQSEYFKKFRTLLNHGADRTTLRETNNERAPTGAPLECERNFREVDIPSRSAVHNIIHSKSQSVQQSVKPAVNGNNRTYTDMLLFHREVNEFEHNTTSNSEDLLSRQKYEQVVNTVRSTFRIPKLSKKLSTSPQVVTSSTSHLVDPNCRDDHRASSPLPSTSRVSDQSERNRHALGAAVPQRLVNEYVDEKVEDSIQANDVASVDPRVQRSHMIMQDRFVPPVNENVNPDPNVLALSRVDNGSKASGQPVVSQPGPSLAVEKRFNLPNRSELFNVKRTIRNDIVQPQSLSSMYGLHQPVAQPYMSEVAKFNPPQQHILPSLPMHGNFQSTFAGGNMNSFNRALMPGYAGMNLPSMFNGGMLGMQQPENNVNNLIAMLWEQCRQQQVNQPAMPPSVMSMAASNQNPHSQLPGMGQLFPQMSVPPAVPQQFEAQRANEQLEVISFTFGCIDFLTNKCIKTHCRYSHVVPREEEVFQKLIIQNRDAIMAAYKFVASRDDLFIKYFPVFASVMGRNNMRHQLVSTITDCEQPKRPIQYYKYIVEGLKMNGTNPVQAVQILLDKHTKRNFHQINVLIDLIMDTGEGIPTFLRTLEEFSNVRDYRFEIVSINRLLEFCNKCESPSNELVLLVTKLILNVPAGEEHLVTPGALVEFTGKVRLDPELTINVEYIVRKYGKIEMNP